MRKINFVLSIGVLLALMCLVPGHNTRTLTLSADVIVYSYRGGSWNLIEGEGIMGIDGTISTPNRVMFGIGTGEFLVQGATIELYYSAVNCSSWALYVHDSEANDYKTVDSNRTALSENYRLSGDVVANGIAIAIVEGSATLQNLTVRATEATPQDLLDWLLYQMVPPWVIQVGALICILIFIILLIAPKGEKTKVGMYG